MCGREDARCAGARMRGVRAGARVCGVRVNGNVWVCVCVRGGRMRRGWGYVKDVCAYGWVCMRVGARVLLGWCTHRGLGCVRACAHMHERLAGVRLDVRWRCGLVVRCTVVWLLCSSWRRRVGLGFESAHMRRLDV